MSEIRDLMTGAVREPWLYSVLLLSITPLFPDYFCFPLVVAAFALALVDAKKQQRHISFGKLGMMMLIYLAYMALSLLYSSDVLSSFWTLMMWGCMFLAYLTFATVLFERRRLRAAILCMTTTTGAVGTVAVLQYILRELFGLGVSEQLWEGLDRLVYGWLQIPVSSIDHGDRVSGTFNNPNLLAAYLVLTIPFSIAFVMTGTRSRPKATARIALILSVYALGFSFCRGGYLALIAVGLLLTLLYIRKKFVMTVLAIIYVILLIPPSIGSRLASVIPLSADQPADTVQVETAPDLTLQETVQQVTQDVAAGYKHDYSVNMRFVMWEKVLQSSAKSPLFGAGVGIGSTQQVLDAANLEFKHAHNLFLELFAEGGILSLALFFCIIWLLCERGRKLLLQRKDNEAWLLGFAIFSACMALCILGVFDFPLLTPRVIATCMMLMGITEAAARIYLKVAVPEPYNLKQLRVGQAQKGDINQWQSGKRKSSI